MSSAAERNLLFGLLALQTGLIDQGALFSAFHAWTRDKSLSLADILVDRKSIDDSRRSLLDGLVSEHLKVHGNDVERSLAALSAGRSTRESLAAVGDPELTATICNLPDALLEPVLSSTMGNPSPSVTEAGAEATMSYVVGGATSEGQRFRVLRPHARGGLGAVFVALDGELHREVALKQILDSHADDPVSRQRFLVEAEITGGLEHPGIVPVYGLGYYQDGRPFYAMRFVRGDSLKEAIAHYHADQSLKSDPGRKALELRKLLRRFLDVCNAIHYAHTRGVLHRDLKPGNIIVGKHGETLVVDWGLAKASGRPDPEKVDEERTLIPSSGSGSAETLPGSALGTPAYMSPEQARGDLDALGPSSDVYSLGATLYCLLTGRPPFEGSVGEVLRAVQAGSFLRPCKVDASIDPALEAICLKAMSMKPADRYSTARALAEDVERWTADEPVTAWREPIRRRLARWQVRHPALVYGGVAALMVTIVGLAVIAMTTEQQKTAIEKARAAAEAKNSEASQAFDQAASATYYMLNRLADSRLVREPGLLPLRKELTDEAIKRFQGFLAYRENDPILIGFAARANRDAAVVRLLIGDFPGAKEAVLRGVELQEQASGKAESVMLLFPLIESYLDAARVFDDYGRDADAARYLALARQKADKALAGLAKARPSEQATFRTSLDALSGRIAYKEGQAYRARGDFKQARASFAKAIQELSDMVKDTTNWIGYGMTTVQARRALGAVAQEQGDTAEADREFADAIRLARGLVARSPDEPDAKYVLGLTLGYDAGRQPDELARSEAIDREFDESLSLLDETNRHNPARLEAALDRSDILFMRGRHRAATGREKLALDDLQAAVAATKELRDGIYKHNQRLSGHLGQLELTLGQLQVRMGQKKEGGATIASAIALLEQAQRDRPTIVINGKTLEAAKAALREVGAE